MSDIKGFKVGAVFQNAKENSEKNWKAEANSTAKRGGKLSFGLGLLAFLSLCLFIIPGCPVDTDRKNSPPSSGSGRY